MKRTLAVFCLALSICSAALAGAVNLPKSSPVRKQCLDIFRPVMERDIGQRHLIFQVTMARMDGNFVFIMARPLRSDGKQINYKNTHYREGVDEGGFDDGSASLYKKVGGHWRLIKWAMGFTDVAYIDWPNQFGCSYSLIGQPHP